MYGLVCGAERDVETAAWCIHHGARAGDAQQPVCVGAGHGHMHFGRGFPGLPAPFCEDRRARIFTYGCRNGLRSGKQCGESAKAATTHQMGVVGGTRRVSHCGDQGDRLSRACLRIWCILELFLYAGRSGLLSETKLVGGVYGGVVDVVAMEVPTRMASGFGELAGLHSDSLPGVDAALAARAAGGGFSHGCVAPAR